MTRRTEWLLATLTAAALAGCTAEGEPQNGPASRPAGAGAQSIVATVDGAPILLWQVTAEANGADLHSALGRLIDQRLALSAARKLGLDRDPIIRDALVRLMRERGLVADPSESRDALVERAFKLGLDREPRIEKAMVALLFDRKAVARRPSEEAIRAEYERRRDELNTPATVRLSDILIKPLPEGQGPTDALAARVRDALAASPESFATLARKYSAGASAALGGDLGMVSEQGTAALAPAVASAAFALSPNTPSRVVRGHDGLHILLVKEHRAAVPRSLDDVRMYLTRDLEAREAERSRRAYLAELRAKARIAIHQERLTVVALAKVSR